ncbi:MAG TPA: LysR family transcriptional regulator [Steroidobacteraceae bacterium]|nr:LysR family transcriptional regulator [Steroidobacteraceae bacterium]
MSAFAHVSELKSFTAAARVLGVPKVAVSRAIVSLERRLGTRLLVRTTRRVSLTPAGELLRPHCQRLLAEVEAVRARFGPVGADARQLRLLVDPGYGRLLVTPLVPRFMESYPDVQLTVNVVDSPPASPGAEWDLLICNGAPAQSELTQTLLGSPPLLLCATPGYLSQHGRPRKPADLLTHTVLQPATATTLLLRRQQESQELRLRPALQVDDPALVHSSAAAGLGIAVVPEFLCRQGLALGKLERVLPDWTVGESLQLLALYAADRASSSAIRQFLEFLLANLVPVLGTSEHVPGGRR